MEEKFIACSPTHYFYWTPEKQCEKDCDDPSDALNQHRCFNEDGDQVDCNPTKFDCEIK